MHRSPFIAFVLLTILTFSAQADSYYMSYHEYSSTVRRAQAAYQLKDFDEAYRLGLKCAQLGDKDCQWLLGILYLKGAGVERNGLEALAWMTVAIESRQPARLEIYDGVMEQLPEAARASVQERGQQYVERYGMRAQNVYCTRRADTGSHIPRVVCNKQRW